MERHATNQRRPDGTAQQDDEPYRCLLQAAAHLRACAAQEEGAANEDTRTTTRSTRVLVRLIEGWCIDHAVKSGHAALNGLAKEQRDDRAVLAALRGYVGQAG